MARYHGKAGVVYMSSTGTGDASSVTLTEWSLDQARDRVEVTSLGDANKQYVVGLPDTSGSFSGFWDDTDDKVFDAAESADGVKLYLYPSTDAPTFYWYGPAWVDASISVGVTAAVAVSGTFAANGAWGRKP